VALVGLSGTGKSTVAPLLAARRGLAVVDLDRAVAESAGRTVAEIFATDGEAAFRSMESAALADALMARAGRAFTADASRSIDSASLACAPVAE
jgi:shikimate kinase